MGAKEVLDRQRSARAVTSSIATHGAAAGERLATHFAEVLQRGERAPDVAFVLELFARMITRDVEALMRANDRHETEKSDDDAPRSARDEAAAMLRDACAVARDGILAVYGDPALGPLGLAESVPLVRDAEALVLYAERVATKLADEGVALPSPKVRGLSADRGALAASVRDALPALKRSLADVARERRELESTQVEKDLAVTRYDTTFSLAASVTSALLRAAGMTEQADRVRPSIRRPGRIEDDLDKDTSPSTPGASNKQTAPDHDAASDKDTGPATPTR